MYTIRWNRKGVSAGPEGEHTLKNIKLMCKVTRTLSPRKSNSTIFDQMRTGF